VLFGGREQRLLSSRERSASVRFGANLGKVEQIGTPLEPNLFVAGFIGAPSMNLLRGNVRRNDLGLVVSLAGLDLPVPWRVRR
jgi:ABC-type sugar transport system ATPase subunit